MRTLLIAAALVFGAALPIRSQPAEGDGLATAIHDYEAILATLAILVWHFDQVIFDPGVYPMNWAWLDGKTGQRPHESSGREEEVE